MRPFTGNWCSPINARGCPWMALARRTGRGSPMQHAKGPEPHRLVNQLFCVVSFESSLRAAEADRMDKLPEADLDLVRVASGKRKVTELLWTSGPLHDAGVREEERLKRETLLGAPQSSVRDPSCLPPSDSQCHRLFPLLYANRSLRLTHCKPAPCCIIIAGNKCILLIS